MIRHTHLGRWLKTRQGVPEASQAFILRTLGTELLKTHRQSGPPPSTWSVHALPLSCLGTPTAKEARDRESFRHTGIPDVVTLHQT